MSESLVAQKRDIKFVIPLPTMRGLILLFLFIVLAFGIPSGWLGVEHRVMSVSQEGDNVWIMKINEQPGILRAIFRPSGEMLYVRKLGNKGTVEWYTYPNSRQIIFHYPYEDMYKSFLVEKEVDHKLK